MKLDTNIVMLTSGFINTVDDVEPGGGDAPGAAPGQVNKVYDVDTEDPWDTTVGIALPGKVRFVKFLLTSTLAAAKGQIAYWSDRANGVVTADVPAGIGVSDVAGIFLGAPTKGSHTFIKISGEAEVGFLGTTTKGTPVVGNVAVNGAAGGVADVLADATAVTFGTAATAVYRIMGILRTLVVSDLATVDLKFLGEAS